MKTPVLWLFADILSQKWNGGTELLGNNDTGVAAGLHKGYC